MIIKLKAVRNLEKRKRYEKCFKRNRVFVSRFL